MCEPLTVAAIATTVVGAEISRRAALQRGATAQAVAERNAATADRQAVDAIGRAALPSFRAQVRGSQVVGAQRVAYGASGVDVNVGSAGDVQEQTRLFTKLEEEVIRNNAAREAYGYRTRAGAFRQEGEYARSEADNAALASVIGGVGRIAEIGGRAWLDRPSTASSNDEDASA